MNSIFSRTSVRLAAVAALFVLAAAYFIISMFGGQQEVVVARVIVKPGKVVAATDVKLQQIPKSAVPKGAITKTENVVGKSVKVIRYPGDTIKNEMLTGKETEELAIRSGEYIVAVELTGSSVADMVADGDTIAIMPLSVTSATTGQGTVEPPIISGIKVLRVDRKEESGSALSGSTAVVATLYVIVDAKQVQAIGKAKSGKYDVILEKKAG